jgi:hypothetical protein
MPASVFSGAYPLAPRWPMVLGNRIMMEDEVPLLLAWIYVGGWFGGCDHHIVPRSRS